MSRSLRATTTLLAALALSGCAGTPAPTVPAPAAPAARYVPPADRYVRSVLLDFESPLDLTFVDGDAKTVAVDPTSATNRVLSAGAGTTIRLGALVRGRVFPGAWDLVGVRLFSPERTTCGVALADDGVALDQVDAPLAAGRWRTVWLDLRKLAATTRPSASMPAEPPLMLLVAPSLRPVLVDEVVLAQSRIVVAESKSPRTGETFRVARVGTTWRATLGDRTLVELPAAPFVDDGYRVDEANAVRVAFRTSSGDAVCVDRLGRVTRGEAANVPTISIVDGAARIDRDRPGDRDNDGFDDSRNCYAIRATGGRFTFRIDGSPTAPTSWPTIDVVGLAAGAVSVWVEGQVVGSVTRLADGATTIELPLDVQRPIDVQVRVRE